MYIQITCINKDNGNHENPYVAIRHLGWYNPSTNERGKSTRLDIYNYIKKGNQAFVVDRQDGSRVYLETRTSSKGTKYVRTIPNDTGRDNLLSLPECP